PVLTIPPTRKFISFKKILFPIRPVSSALLSYDIISRFLSPDSTLEILGVTNLKAERQPGLLSKIVEGIRDKLVADNINVKTSWGNGNSVPDDIVQSIQSGNPELIVLTASIDAVSKPNFIGPYSQRLINSSMVPLLSVKKIGIPALA